MFGTGIFVRTGRLIAGSGLPGSHRIARAMGGLPEPAPPIPVELPPIPVELPPVTVVADLPEQALLGRFTPYAGPAEPEFMIDFLGGRTRVAFIKGYEDFAGRVLEAPRRGHEVLHEHDEWLGTLAAVIDAEARGEIVAIELGAGWGPWLVAVARAAAQIPAIRSVRLLGLEATPSHHAMMLQHFEDNGLHPAAHELLLAAAGDTDGVARFSKLPDPSADWGAGELSAAEIQAGGNEDAEPAYDEVPRFAIAGLVRRYPNVDLLHVDIQGAEETALPLAMAALNERVRRVVVGTHSRAIDASLTRAFEDAGWTLEARHPCTLNADGIMSRDGTQVWRNNFV